MNTEKKFQTMIFDNSDTRDKAIQILKKAGWKYNYEGDNWFAWLGFTGLEVSNRAKAAAILHKHGWLMAPYAEDNGFLAEFQKEINLLRFPEVNDERIDRNKETD